jgi:hypothetical protein
MSVGAIEYYCAEACFKNQEAFPTGKIELDLKARNVTCYCQKRTTNDFGPVE